MFDHHTAPSRLHPGPSSHLKETYPAPYRPHPGPSSHLNETSAGPSHHLKETITAGPSCHFKETSPGPSHWLKETSPVTHKLRMFIEVPPIPPSWRLLSNQQIAAMTQMPPPAPIVRGVDARELIPGIACLTQNSTVMDATVDAVDELDMVGDSPEY
ncbi:hypothetical protein BDR04DRAFT_1149035 [Suillus decipiens]|nr:hypothetical protein BDR04DRAFT_1149035 [Suillus decipiens]